MKQQERYKPQRCNVQLRGKPDDEPIACEEFTDVDSLTGATLELVKLHDVEFIPFADIRTIEFEAPSVALPALITLAGGRTTSGLVPLFYLFTDFAESAKVRSGKVTLYRAIVPGIVAGVGMRSFNSTRGLLPLANIERIDFK
jgi:protein involved in temperature-dependent protein secretion